MTNTRFAVTIDSDADAAYAKVSEAKVVRTSRYSDDVLVDIDEYDMVVGFEFLTLQTEIDLEDFAKMYHLRSDVIDFIRSAVHSRSSFSTSMATGVASSSNWLAPA